MLLPDSELRNMKVLFATPCYISAVSMNYVTSMFELVSHAKNFGLDCMLHMHSEILITRGRNMIAMKFLADESLPHLFFIDSDIVYKPQSVCRILLADRDVAAAVYPIKRLNWPQGGMRPGATLEDLHLDYNEYAFNPIMDSVQQVSKYVDEDGLVEVAEAPTGFMCIKRNVFLKLMESYPHLHYTPDGPPGHPLAHLHWRFFDCMVDPDTDRYLSEDYAFCRLWRDIGGKVWVDVDCKLGHLGQHLYEGNLFETLRRQGRW